MAFFILFTILTSWHVFILGRKRVWYFIPLAVGGTRKSSSTFLAIYLPTEKGEHSRRGLTSSARQLRWLGTLLVSWAPGI
jgi:hypothetical protein